MTGHDSVYNDPAYDITSVPTWKSPPLHGAYAPNARLSPRAKAAIGAGAVVLAASGMVAWSNYAAAQADAEVRQAQIGLEASKVDLQRQQQAAQVAQAAGQETEAQKARRQAVQACIAKAGGNFNAVADCGKAYPSVDQLGMVNTAQTVTGGKSDDGSSSGAGLIVLGTVGAAMGAGWLKKRFART
ncbi:MULTISPECIES: hypothetical protein [Kitasatospora]|uniref:Uncharacterized protein n=2 Tax=Kitasatospora TaxID=2063 RepID=A0ABT1IVU6_9ACTN|nr:hypothetical protein [Kitasatospora paracochleata]MCP2309255.1 hypothetical protein [Kitasatospora paracochleata]